MKEMSDGVVALNGETTRSFDAEDGGRADGRRRGVFRISCSVVIKEVQPCVARLLGIDDAPELGANAEFAGIADLATHFSVKRGRVEDDSGPAFHRENVKNFGGSLQLVVSNEFCSC